jgi:late competence protein required for DNA uptake (superfamily II DNA/RNA helicase)
MENPMYWFYLAIILIGVFNLGKLMGNPSVKKKKTTKTIASNEKIYCFQCEIEMPAKEKDGRFYCTNCKLYH